MADDGVTSCNGTTAILGRDPSCNGSRLGEARVVECQFVVLDRASPKLQRAQRYLQAYLEARRVYSETRSILAEDLYGWMP
jgi:hypothetical protein